MGKCTNVNGTLKIGNQIWDPIFGGIYTNNAGRSVSNLYFYSRVDHYPDFKNN
jgi:hypothetical protein